MMGKYRFNRLTITRSTSCERKCPAWVVTSYKLYTPSLSRFMRYASLKLQGSVKDLLHELRGTWNWRNCPAVSPCWLPSKSGRWQTTSFFHYWDLKPCSSGSAGLMLPYIHLNLSLNLSALQSKDKRSCLPIKYIIAKLRPVWDERHGCLKTKLGRRTFSSLWKLHPIY